MSKTIVFISDVHAGAKGAVPVATGLQSILDTVKQMPKANELVVAIAGDMVTGEQVYEAQQMDLNANISAQIFEILVPLFAKFIEKLKEVNNNITILTTPGNHGRIKGYSKDFNADVTFARTLETLLTERYGDNITIINAPIDQCGVETIVYDNIVMEHGHKIFRNQSIPYYGIDRRAYRYKSMYSDMSVYLVGHNHTPFWLSANNINIFGNGSFARHDPFAKDVCTSNEEPCQWVISEDYAGYITSAKKVYLNL